jgi:predicted transcriptional regulator
VLDDSCWDCQLPDLCAVHRATTRDRLTTTLFIVSMMTLRRGVGEYDNCMKRITVSLPDELVEKIKRAAGGNRQVSSYVATALEDYQERENLDDILAAWRVETPVPEEVQRQVEAELDQVGLTGAPGSADRLAG